MTTAARRARSDLSTLRALVEHVADRYDVGLFQYSTGIRSVVVQADMVLPSILLPGCDDADQDELMGMLLVSAVRCPEEGFRAYTCVEPDGSERTWVRMGPGAPLEEWDDTHLMLFRDNEVLRHPSVELAAVRKYQTGTASCAVPEHRHRYWDPAYFVTARVASDVAESFLSQLHERFAHPPVSLPLDAQPTDEELAALREQMLDAERYEVLFGYAMHQLRLLRSLHGWHEAGLHLRFVTEEGLRLPELDELAEVVPDWQRIIDESCWDDYDASQLATSFALDERRYPPKWWGPEGIGHLLVADTRPFSDSLFDLGSPMLAEPGSIIAGAEEAGGRRMDHLFDVYEGRRFTGMEACTSADGYALHLPMDARTRYPWAVDLGAAY